MPLISNQLLLPLCVVLVVVTAIYRCRSGRVLRKIRGPPSPSFLMGHSEEINGQNNVGDLERMWFEQYGSIWRLKGCLGEDQLMVADPKALCHILQKSEYQFGKGAFATQVAREVAGDGLLAAGGENHARMRKIINPAFSALQLKSFLPTFQRVAQKLGRKWTEELQSESQTTDNSRRLNVLDGLTRCTLDIIGETAFDIDCGALDNSFNSVIKAYKNMFANSFPNPGRIAILVRSLLAYLPERIVPLVRYIPTKDHVRLRRTLDLIHGYARSLIKEKTEALMAGKADNERDIMSILVKANTSDDPNQRLSDSEFVSQMSTFLLAGHETTSNAMAWLLYEIARHTEYQEKLREEIRFTRARVRERGETDFTILDLESMQYVSATVKEVLRLHPIVYTTVRVPTRDEVVPLAFPVINEDGESIEEVHVPSGTNVYISIWQYNRHPQLWGSDANEFNPGRFFDRDRLVDTTVGVSSNLLTFGGGPQACIGWKFTMIEMQTILVELLEHFAFSIPPDRPEIIRLPATLTIPVVKNEMAAGAQMPLRISLL